MFPRYPTVPTSLTVDHNNSMAMSNFRPLFQLRNNEIVLYQ